MDSHMPDHGMNGGMHDGAPMGQGKTCRCGHHKVLPILVIILGLEFLFAELNVLTWAFVNVTWPILVIIAGVVALMGRSCKCCGK